MEEAKEVIKEEITIVDHAVDSPRTDSDRIMRINVAMDFDQDDPDQRAAFKLFKRSDVRDIANFLRIKNYMDGT
eukprot:684753-Heterocapsa_arctica.AAC.1